MAGILSRLFGRRHEQRDFFGAGLGFAPFSGGRIGPYHAENVATVMAAVQCIATALATCPPAVLCQLPDGKAPAVGHPLSALIVRPNDRQTWVDFIEWWASQTLLFGNGLAGIEFGSSGRPTELVPIPWQHVSVRLLPNGRLAYDVVSYFGPFGGTGLPRRWLQDEVLHLKDRSDDGYLGRSRLSRSAEVIEGALGLQRHSLAMWHNGTSLSGILSHPKSLSRDAKSRLQSELDEVRGVHNARKTLVLEEGLSWTAVGVSPEQAEVLDSRRFSVEEIARVYGVPPPILQDYTRNTFSNAATAGAWFGQFTVVPWVRKVEAEFSRVLLTDPQFQLELDVSGLMRGDYAQRWEANVAAVNSGILTPNEVRAEEGWNRHTDGDLLRVLPGAPLPKPQAAVIGE